MRGRDQGLTAATARVLRLGPAGTLGRLDALGALAVVLATLLVYLPYAFDGSLVTDDWEYARAAAFDGLSLGEAWHYIAWEGIRHGMYRPLGGFVDRAQHIVSDSDAPGIFLPLVIGTVLQCTLLYTVLRQLRVAAPWALAAALLYILLPSVDTTRFWSTASFQSLAVAAWLGGLALALQGLRSHGIRAVLWHAPAIPLFMCAVWLHEAVTPAIWVGGVLYVLVAGRRRAAAPWAAAVVSSSIAFFPMVGDAEQRGSDASLGHMTDRVGDLFRVYAYIIRLDLPFDQLLEGPAGVLLLLASAVGIGLALERRDEAAEWARHWAAVALFAAVATAAGLAVFIPADDVFTPVWQGTDNRFSVAAAPGTAVLILALCCLVAIGLASLAGRARWAGLVAAALVGLTAAQMSTDLFDSRGEWEQAQVEQAKIIDAVEEAVGGRVKPGETVVIGHQLRVVPDGGPPVFVAPWDLDGALKLRYDDPTVSARVIESHAKCRASALTIDIASGPGAKSFPYDHLAFVDVSVPSATRVTGRKKCETAVRKLLE